jgi:hypothetical protein
MCQKQEIARGDWSSAMVGGGTVRSKAVVVLTGPCPFWSLQPDHTVGACSRWACGGGRWTRRLEPRPVPR